MKKIFLALMVSILFLASSMAWGAGVVLPRIIAPHTLAWDDPNLPAVGVTGYRVYYRIVATPVNPWDDMRMGTVTAPTKTLDLGTLLTTNGDYECAVSAVNVSGESGLSNIVPFVLSIPQNPTNARKQ